MIQAGEVEKLDDFDLRILTLLKANSRRTGEDLSVLVGLSPAACLRRVQRLRKIGAIAREVAILAPELENKGTTIVVILQFSRQNPKDMDEYCKRLRQRQQVERLIWVTGQDDVVVILNCASMAEFSEFAQENFDEEPIGGYKALVSMREYETPG